MGRPAQMIDGLSRREWAERLGVSYESLRQRFYREGRTPDGAHRLHRYTRSKRSLAIDVRIQQRLLGPEPLDTVQEVAMRFGISVASVRCRIRRLRKASALTTVRTGCYPEDHAEACCPAA